MTSQRRAECGQDVAMRYYRLWIYTCNLVLLGSALGFAAAVSRTLLFTGDPRRYVVPGVPRAYDPTALYAYLALATQLGLVQLLGCIAARRLSARLLNAYWVLLLALLFGDAVIGVAWVFRFERMRAELRPTLRQRLQVSILYIYIYIYMYIFNSLVPFFLWERLKSERSTVRLSFACNLILESIDLISFFYFKY